MKITKSQIYQCDICGKKDVWTDSWYSHIFPYDIRSDMHFHVCSEYCDRQLLNMTTKQKKKLFTGN